MRADMGGEVPGSCQGRCLFRRNLGSGTCFVIEYSLQIIVLWQECPSIGIEICAIYHPVKQHGLCAAVGLHRPTGLLEDERLAGVEAREPGGILRLLS